MCAPFSVIAIIGLLELTLFADIGIDVSLSSWLLNKWGPRFFVSPFSKNWLYNLTIFYFCSYMSVGCSALSLILKTFSSLIKNNIAAPPGIGVDISREERYVLFKPFLFFIFKPLISPKQIQQMHEVLQPTSLCPCLCAQTTDSSGQNWTILSRALNSHAESWMNHFVIFFYSTHICLLLISLIPFTDTVDHFVHLRTNPTKTTPFCTLYRHFLLLFYLYFFIVIFATFDLFYLIHSLLTLFPAITTANWHTHTFTEM